MKGNRKLKYLALGDSYTIGTAIARSEAFPYQLANLINEETDVADTMVKVVASNAWRTDDLQRAIKRTDLSETYDLVSLLIGVNNQYQGLTLTDFSNDLKSLLDTCEKYCVGKHRIFVLSIPNYGYTPYGEANRDVITRELKVFNQKTEEICKERGISVFNITDISLEAAIRPNFVAKDKLHPSSIQYNAWISSFLNSVIQKLEE